jgi:hypothetical protein
MHNEVDAAGDRVKGRRIMPKNPMKGIIGTAGFDMTRLLRDVQD